VSIFQSTLYLYRSMHCQLLHYASFLHLLALNVALVSCLVSAFHMMSLCVYGLALCIVTDILFSNLLSIHRAETHKMLHCSG
jgi:hypothetical protein